VINESKIITYGLIGKNLEHSWSKSYFDRKFREERIPGCHYENFQLRDLTEIKSLIISKPGLLGLNITIPFKEQILQYLDEIDPIARETGAVNVIRITRHDKKINLAGFNTDAPAFQDSLRPLLTGHDQRAIVLGTGGASKAVQFALRKLGIEYILVSRSAGPARLTYKDLVPGIFKNHQLIINATPAGMYPEVDICPLLPYNALNSGHLLYDLVYNPEETLFLKKGRLAGARIKNGLEMLKRQAELSWKIWER